MRHWASQLPSFVVVFVRVLVAVRVHVHLLVAVRGHLFVAERARRPTSLVVSTRRAP